MPQITVPSPVGPLTLREEEGAITRVTWTAAQGEEEETPVLAEAKRQLEAYFEGELARFDLPLKPAGPDLHRAVWDQMLAIPTGETRTYGEIAKAIDSDSPQAVGQACGANPIPVIIPCHRVLAAGGAPGGYSGDGGLETKAALLRLEGYILPLQGKLL